MHDDEIADTVPGHPDWCFGAMLTGPDGLRVLDIYPLANRHVFMDEWPYRRRGSLDIVAPTPEQARKLAVRVIEAIKRGEDLNAAVARMWDELHGSQ